jgi:hypothetical protein
MKYEDNGPVHVTGEERQHPAIRKLARAAIELARLRLARQQQGEQQASPDHAAPTTSKEVGDE